MVQYSSIRYWKNSKRKVRTIDGLLRLRKALYTEVTRKRDQGSILLASWNLRDFDSNKLGSGPRLEESYLYMAEIISAFDLIALQEVNRDLTPLKNLMRILGRKDWDYIVTDTTEGTSGNQERMAYVYNTKKVSFAHMAGEVVLPGKDTRQFARTPFLASFQAGWFKFNLCTVHMYFGSGSAGIKRRTKEIDDLAKFVTKRQEREGGEDYILLGDFNIKSLDHDTMKALLKYDFTMHEDIMDIGTTLKGENPYDQIAMKIKNGMFELGDAGMFNFEDYVFRNKDHKDFYNTLDMVEPEDGLITESKEQKYIDGLKKTRRAALVRGMQTIAKREKGRDLTKAEKDEIKTAQIDEALYWNEQKTKDAIEKYYKTVWRSFQLSDHKPIWVELKVDFTNDYLDSLRPEKEPLADFA